MSLSEEESFIMMPKNYVLPGIPDKRYFTIGEASDLCLVKPHVLRYWEQEFSILKPSKRRGNRRYYQRKDIELIRQIRDLLYTKGFTIQGARKELMHLMKGVAPIINLHHELTPIFEISLKTAASPESRMAETVPISAVSAQEITVTNSKKETVNQLINELESLLAEINI